MPDYVLYDRLCLRFDGYYVDDGPASSAWASGAAPAAHAVKLTYYLEDDTICVTEPVTQVRSGRRF